MVVHSLVCGLLLCKSRLLVVELRGFVGIKNSWNVPLSKGIDEQILCVANDICLGFVLTKKRRRCFLILLLLLVHRSALIINCKLPTFTRLGHWLCRLFEKENHLPFVFYTDVNIIEKWKNTYNSQKEQSWVWSTTPVISQSFLHALFLTEFSCADRLRAL